MKTNPGKPVSYVIVKDIAADGAFDQVVQANPPFEAVIHTASPFHFKTTDNKRDMLDPAINGTTGILKSIKGYAPSVKRVVITSSAAAITSAAAHKTIGIYTESVWNPIMYDEAVATKDGNEAYRGSKKLAEKAAWDFVDSEKPRFDIATLNPPFVYGPMVHDIKSLDDLNTSNIRILDFMRGAVPKSEAGYADVRDLAEAHVLAIEVPEAGGKRFIINAGLVQEKAIVEVLGRRFPELASKLSKEGSENRVPYIQDNTRSKVVLGLKYRSIEECVVDLAKQLLQLGA